MSRQTTTQESHAPFLHGWLSSIALHGLLLVSFLPLFRQSLLPLPHEPFHWEVALAHSPQPDIEPIPATDTLRPALLKRLDQTPLVHHSNHPIRPTTSSTESIHSLESKAVIPATPEPQPSILSSETSGREAASALISEDPAPKLSQASGTPLQQAAPPTRSTAQEPPIPQTVATTDDRSSLTPDTAQPPSPPATASDSAAVSATRPDYGWLQQAIFQRLEELKRSSHPSLDDSRPLKVTVKAVVSREGTLLDFVVVKSSGLHRIDQEAMALVQRAFPMQLDRPLDRQQIAMRIPITYSRE